MAMENDLEPLIQEIRRVVIRYRELTGRPLGVTGELAELEAARLLNLKLAKVRQAGYDATDGKTKIQIKGRSLPGGKVKGRMPAINLEQPWDDVVLVLMDEHFNTTGIWRATSGKGETCA